MSRFRPTQSQPNLRQRLVIGAVIGLTALQPVMQAASSLPTGGTFVAGSGNISGSGNTLTINQSSLRGIIDWNTFSIGKGASVSFKNGSGATLNRVNGGPATSILGQLLATGNVYLINPEGILIGHGATIHTGGDFLASTLNLSNSAFLNGGPLTFAGSSPATVVNLGDLTSTGGSVYLIGHSVQNAGSINTPNGTTGLAAGSQVLITDSSTDQKVAVQAPGGDVTNSGFVHAAQAELKSNGGNIYALAGNNGGQINATGTATQDGHVWLVATNGTTNVSGLISATNANGTGGSIETSGAHVVTSGAQLKTGKNGNWLLDPDDLTIDSTLAGTIETSLNGGTNVTEQTTASGTGGSGDITVASNIAWTTGADLTLSAYRNIGINNGVTISNTGAGNLTLRADNTSNGTGAVAINGLVDFSASTGNVSILYDPVGSESTKYTAPVTYNTGVSGTQVMTNSAWVAPTDLSVSSQATAYMLVNNVTDLQNVSTSLAGTYAMGTDIDATSVSNFTPIAHSSTFTGIFDGQGHTISNLTIDDTTDNHVGLFGYSTGTLRNLNLTGESITGSQEFIGGLVGFSTGVVANDVSAGTVSIATNYEEPYIGGIAAVNEGTLTNSSSSATVSVSNVNGFIWAGGLVGINLGPISTSYATGSVTITAPSSPTAYNGHAGGLVGFNESSITSSYATGNVNVGSASNIEEGNAAAGGLVGYAPAGSLTNTYATGTVTGGTNVYTGGLAGYSDASVTSSYAVGSVSAATTNFGGGLIGNHVLGTITSSYWDTQATGQSGASGNSATISGATGEITSVLQSGTLPTGFSSSNWVSASGFYPLLIWQEKVISGDVFNGSSPLASVTVDALANGVNIGSATTNGSGFYSFYVPLAYVSGVSGVLTYLPGTTKGNTFSDGDASGEYTGMNIYAGTLLLLNRTNSTYSGMLTALNSALGSNSGVNFLFSPNSGNITLNTGTNLSIDSQLAFSLDKAINTSGTVTIQSQGDVSQSEPITANALSLSGAGNFSLGQSNNIGTLAANTGGNVDVTNSGDIIIGTAGGVTGVTSGGTVSINSTSGNLTIASGSTVTASGSGDALQLSAGNAFLNLEGSDALNISDGGGRWLVFSQNPANDTRGGLAYDFKQYSYNAAVDSPAQATGNGFIYTYAPTVTIGLTGTISKTYDGTTAATLAFSNYSVTGGIDGDTVTLSDTPTPTSGNYENQNYGLGKTVNASGLSLSNLSISNGAATIYGYQLASGTASGNIGTINPATLIYTANSVSRTYGSNNPTFSGTVTGFVNDETLSSATTGTAAFTTEATSGSNHGTYAIDGSGLTANNGNYTFVQADLNSSALTINPAQLIYTASSTGRTYGSNPTLTGSVTGFVLDQTLSSATTGTPTFTTEATSASSVGTYAITGSGLTANNGNYTFTQADGNSSALTINPALLTYTANAAGRTYGSGNPAFTGTVTGLVLDQTLSSVATGTASFTTSATSASNVGNYAINGSGLTLNTGNYTLTQAEGNSSAFTINPATLTYTANSGNRTYGASNPTFNGTVTGFVLDQTLASATTGSTMFTSPATLSSNVGTYAINGSGLTANNGNYTFTQAALNSSALTITPATLTYTANSGSRTYGTGDPAFTGTVTGFVNGQTVASATTGTALFTSSANSGSAVGSYAINGSGLTANHGNYDFVQAPGNATALTITTAVVAPPPAPASTVLTFAINNTTSLYNQLNPTFTAAYTGASISGLNISSILSGLTYQITPSISGPGTYLITATGIAPSGYALNILPGTLTVIGSTPQTIPSQALVTSPILPVLLPPTGVVANNLLQPVNTLGLFQISVGTTANGFGTSFAGFTAQQTPLAQSSFFGGSNDQNNTYFAGAKP